MTLLELREVSRHVELPDGEDLEILTSVDLEVSRGDRVSIVGRSGSGKSTLLNILGLLDLPSSGEVVFHGENVARLSQGKRDRLRGRSVGFIFQQFNLLDGRTALENVMLPLLYSHGSQFWQRERLAREMLERVGLGHRADSLPSSMSGGEQQRVAIARSLVRRPTLLLADEPTGALDVETGITVMGLLEETVESDGAALVTITHDPSIAARSDRTYSLRSGVLRRTDTDVKRAPVVANGPAR